MHSVRFTVFELPARKLFGCAQGADLGGEYWGQSGSRGPVFIRGAISVKYKRVSILLGSTLPEEKVMKVFLNFQIIINYLRAWNADYKGFHFIPIQQPLLMNIISPLMIVTKKVNIISLFYLIIFDY